MPPARRRKPTPRPLPTETKAGQAAAEVWLTDAAVEDLRRLDGAVLVWALKKMLLLEQGPHAGKPLLGTLIGYRKLTVGNRGWRLVWRMLDEERGTLRVEIAEVWAVGARSDGEVYAEIASRVGALPESPARQSLHSVVQALGQRAKGLQARRPAAPAPAPEAWLVDRLVRSVGLPRAAVEAMTSEQAVDAWTRYMMGQR